MTRDIEKNVTDFELKEWIMPDSTTTTTTTDARRRRLRTHQGHYTEVLPLPSPLKSGLPSITLLVEQSE